MAIRLTFNISITFLDEHREAIRAEAVKRLREAKDVELWINEDEEFDPDNLKHCATVLLGDPIDTISGDIEYDRASWGVTSVEEIPEPLGLTDV